MTLLGPGKKIFLLSIDYDQTEYEGPPFSVPREEINEHYAHDFSIEEFHCENQKDHRLSEAGLIQRVSLLIKN
jgi:thiopurine S-methyltransferase